MKYLALIAVAITVAACSPEPSSTPDGESAPPVTNNVMVNGDTTAPTAKAPSLENVLTLEGIGDLRIGRAVPAGGKWVQRGAQASDACRTISSPDYPGVYAVVEQGNVRRITAGQNSAVRLRENIGVGSTEKEVLKLFPGFRAEPHKYIADPAKYLTAPNASTGESALRFEIGANRKVSLIHVGTMPVLGYVEGCA